MLTNEDIKALDWEKTGGLIPAVVQDACSGRVLMLGCMNPEALEKTLETKKVTFWSRTKGRLWTKGETSGNWLHLVDIGTDCDSDALLVLVNPDGPTCHRGTPSCFSPVEHKWNFLRDLEVLLREPPQRRSGHVLHRQPLRPRHQAHRAEGGRRGRRDGARRYRARQGGAQERGRRPRLSPARAPRRRGPRARRRDRRAARPPREPRKGRRGEVRVPRQTRKMKKGRSSAAETGLSCRVCRKVGLILTSFLRACSCPSRPGRPSGRGSSRQRPVRRAGSRWCAGCAGRGSGRTGRHW